MAVFVPLREMLPIVQPHANGCPGFMLEQALRMAAIEMCERGRIWRHLMEFASDQATMDGLIPIEAAIFEFDYVRADGRALTPVQHATLVDEGITAGSPEYVSQLNPWGIVVHPWPAGDGPVHIEMCVFLKPRSDTIVGMVPGNPLADRMNMVPDWMLTQHSHRLADGALASVLMMEGEVWYNPQRAAVYRKRYDDALGRLGFSAMKGQQRAPIRTPFVDM